MAAKHARHNMRKDKNFKGSDPSELTAQSLYCALDTDFDWLRQKNKPRMAIFPIENIAHERCNVLSHCKNGISQLSKRFLTLFCKLIVLVTMECLRTKKSISTWHWELCLEFQGKYFLSFLDILFQCFAVAMTL